MRVLRRARKAGPPLLFSVLFSVSKVALLGKRP